MKKYLQIAKISFRQEFAYRMNFVMWRVRNILQIFIAFYLWSTLFAAPDRQLFGYNREKILTYIFILIFVKAIVLSAKTMDVAGEVARGEISNYLVRPMNFFMYWLSRDLASKMLNVSFAILESLILFNLLKPQLFIQTNPLYLLGFIISLAVALFIYFNLVFLVNAVPFWRPEAAWGIHFLITVVVVEFLSGSLFPLDILPPLLQKIFYLTPFPYLIFYPIEIYLGKVTLMGMVSGIGVGLFWSIILWVGMNAVWRSGLKAYQAYGR